MRTKSEKPKWVHYLTRPFGLFEASLWQHWYESGKMREVFGATTPTGLFIEETRGVTRCYRRPRELNRVYAAVSKQLKDNPERIKKYLDIGIRLNRQTERLRRAGSRPFKSLEEAVAFYTETSLCGGVLPYMIIRQIETLKLRRPPLLKQCMAMRGTTAYPWLMAKAVMPLARKLAKQRFGNPDILPHITYRELLGTGRGLEKPIRSGLWFVYETKKGKEKVSWLDDTKAIIASLEPPQDHGPLIRGTTACKGKITGKARIILRPNVKTRFQKGDILVTTNSNPSFMPFIRKCGALVTDEGGMNSHAAIIARELRKPCVIGTKVATQVLKDGDMIEVDANKGTIIKL